MGCKMVLTTAAASPLAIPFFMPSGRVNGKDGKEGRAGSFGREGLAVVVVVAAKMDGRGGLAGVESRSWAVLGGRFPRAAEPRKRAAARTAKPESSAAPHRPSILAVDAKPSHPRLLPTVHLSCRVLAAIARKDRRSRRFILQFWQALLATAQ